MWNAFGDKVGWLVNKHWIYYDTVTFDDNKAPQGHLPFGIEVLRFVLCNVFLYKG
ncbi:MULTISPECIES: GUN4 domain-containing protein [Microcystis]|uniref:GUN4 domain-containing protein n=1 Tax=Microcystis TaxID=1125 RepID=UPI001E450A4E|nr:GUN4 domain-containing protein [Microcystis viridis]